MTTTLLLELAPSTTEWLLGILAAGNGALGLFLMKVCWRLLGEVSKATAAGNKLADAVTAIDARLVHHEEKDEQMHSEYAKERERAVQAIKNSLEAVPSKVVIALREDKKKGRTA